jgi:hypothetical protein
LSGDTRNDGEPATGVVSLYPGAVSSAGAICSSSAVASGVDLDRSQDTGTYRNPVTFCDELGLSSGPVSVEAFTDERFSR